MLKHLDILVFGRVQAVSFRFFAKQEAERLNIFGFAKNEDNGTVYIAAEGEEKNLKQFLVWCKKGPALAQVQQLKITAGKLKNYTQFSIY